MHVRRPLGTPLLKLDLLKAAAPSLRWQAEHSCSDTTSDSLTAALLAEASRSAWVMLGKKRPSCGADGAWRCEGASGGGDRGGMDDMKDVCAPSQLLAANNI